MPKTYRFDVYHRGEQAAGIRAYEDRVDVVVDSGDPGGDEDGESSFQGYMAACLADWFDGAKITLVHITETP